MKSTSQWWTETKQDQAKLTRWLLAQYHGEAGAAHRIELLRDLFAGQDEKAHRTLSIIAQQERVHASWVRTLLQRRSIQVDNYEHNDRYWSETLPGIEDLETGCAVGAHAERMRLSRIEVIASDPEAPADIREVFQKILPEERFHERAFRGLSTDEALAKTLSAHHSGENALGLVP